MSVFVHKVLYLTTQAISAKVFVYFNGTYLPIVLSFFVGVFINSVSMFLNAETGLFS